jgi:hypothetical protein
MEDNEMLRIENVYELRGRIAGATIMAGFGTIWLLLAFIANQTLNAANAAKVAAVVAAVACGVLYLSRQAERWPSAPRDPAKGRAIGIAFGWIFGLESAAIFASWTILGHLHLEIYGLSAMVGIVGLHFFPLARLFRYPPHFVTGALMTLCAAVSAIWTPIDRMQEVAAFGAGMILMASAVFTLGLAAYAVNRNAIRAIKSPAA